MHDGTRACRRLRQDQIRREGAHPSRADHDYPNEFGGFRSSARLRHARNKAEYKEFTDVLGPLRGAIRKNLGRKWDAVFSEFCRVLDRRSLSGYHIWTHLMQEVQTKTFLQNGVVMERLPFWGSRAVEGFYVHPVTGILCHTQRDSWKALWRRRRAAMKPERIPVPGMDGWNYQKMDGLWFRIKHITHSDVRGKVEQVIIAKRSANRKEIAWIQEQLASRDLHSFAGISDTPALASKKRKSIDSGRAT